ncbi:phenylacetate--CoA ligase family protein [Calidifontimicrobium sp. SYSU G02091]|uniref:phenylacetate--CoA ligase family protein n=1 Tax=Calidifontimicrobium sp. SYSU G02091 TaxID=2926421 RepID=UPI001F534371|nr:phenylacetate--CoA ligase family protein [Calidifontimicrobium sp. SYSU G02091]MCI1193133.1 phenylacetate--CoA ligase family protein [Calidifontimicrobium sp. SYSU G02091]
MVGVFAKALARTVYRTQERAVRRPTFDYLADLERSQWLDRVDIEALQLAKLRELLGVAWLHSPWHRRRLEAAGLSPGALTHLHDLRRLPCMTKQDAAAHHEEMVWHGVPGGAFKYNTGGSSGTPLIFHFGRWRQASDAAGRMRARRWWGVEPGDPEAYLWGAPVELSKTDWVKTVRDRLINQLVLNAFAMSPARMDGYLDALERFSPCCLYGYASSVALLAAHAKERGRRPRLPRLKVVCTTGEPLYPHQRTLIGEVFGAPVANEFGSRDIGFTAHESPDNPAGAMLLMSESIILEVLDAQGQPVAPGELGEAVMTGLCSDAQPFIRYRTGDMVRLSADPDGGGRGLHVIAEVVGRRTDFLVRPDGTIMHALAGIYVLRATEGVGEFKLVQHAVRDLEVLVVPGPGWVAERVPAIEAGLRQRLGDDVRVNVRVVDAIAPEASGKHRYVVSHVPLQGELAQAAAIH